MGFPPFGRVVEGLEVVDTLYAGYGGGPEDGGPRQETIRRQGKRIVHLDATVTDEGGTEYVAATGVFAVIPARG